MSGSIQSTSIKSGRTSTMPRAGLTAVLRFSHFVTRAPQAEGHHVANRLFVFDDEDALGGHIDLVP